MKKTYNPFKMWGSYVGAIILGISAVLLQILAMNHAFREFLLGNVLVSIMIDNMVLRIFIFAIVGFLLGWGIHSLIRRLRK